jgi:hypothetical protein
MGMRPEYGFAGVFQVMGCTLLQTCGKPVTDVKIVIHGHCE